ncbi:hypothetical protein C8F04DRAFT_1262398 [Mycena alexandri]|uniref:Uncharacterized protein n=1 Tax=Mycena alexandri TaxID=1745969 RepID=A0AAD6WYE7_9AGAR|nr:hypothetical protein C8F04DRAFT_1262398 [Mycena alexandri]
MTIPLQPFILLTILCVNCPFVTALVATQINSGSSAHDPESAASLTGGGFSNIFALPDYQQPAVETFYKHHKSTDRCNNLEGPEGFLQVLKLFTPTVKLADGRWHLRRAPRRQSYDNIDQRRYSLR